MTYCAVVRVGDVEPASRRADLAAVQLLTWHLAEVEPERTPVLPGHGPAQAPATGVRIPCRQ